MFLLWACYTYWHFQLLNCVYPSLNGRELNYNHSWSNHFCSVDLHALLYVSIGVVGRCVCVCARALGSVCTCWQHQDPPGKAGRNCVMLLYECRGDCSHSTSTWRPRSAYHCARPAVPFYCGNKSGPIQLHNPFAFYSQWWILGADKTRWYVIIFTMIDDSKHQIWLK